MSIESSTNLTPDKAANHPRALIKAHSLGWLMRLFKPLMYPLGGIALLLVFWWYGGYLVASNPDTEVFAGFGPLPALTRLVELIGDGSLWETIGSSLYRIGFGLFWAIIIGVPLGLALGFIATLQNLTQVPFQFLRMVSPLSWMPIAVLAFDSWDSSIIFLITMAAVWPILFSTTHGVRRMDPLWFKVARNLGANPWHMLRRVIAPAIAQDVLAGIRLAIGVAWIVLVPAEYLGVTSGLGYAINDARDTLEYDSLAAIVVVIGVIGYLLDSAALFLIRRANWHIES